MAGQPVTLDRRRNGEWHQVAALVTDAEGEAVSDLPLARDASDNVVRATYDGDDVTYAGDRTGPVQLRMERREGIVTLDGPGSVVDERAGDAHRALARPQRHPGPRAGHGRAPARRRRLEAGRPTAARARTAPPRSPPAPGRTPAGGPAPAASTG